MRFAPQRKIVRALLRASRTQVPEATVDPDCGLSATPPTLPALVRPASRLTRHAWRAIAASLAMAPFLLATAPQNSAASVLSRQPTVRVPVVLSSSGAGPSVHGRQPAIAEGGSLAASPGRAPASASSLRPSKSEAGVNLAPQDPIVAASRARRTAAQRAYGQERPTGTTSQAAIAQTETNCEQVPLPAGESFTESLAVPDCRWGQVTNTTVVSFVDQYRMTLPERSEVSLQVQAAFDMYVSVHDAGYAPITDGFSVDGGPASIDTTLPAGSYVILVTSLSDAADVGGDYQVEPTIRPVSEPACEALALDPGAGSTRDVPAGGCRVYDWLPLVMLDNPALVYEIVLPEAGMLSGSVTSTALEPRHALINADNVTLSSDINDTEDQAPGTTSFALPVPAGRYRLLVLGAKRGTGAITVDTSFAPVGAACDATLVEANSTTAGTLNDADCFDGYLNNGIIVRMPMDLFDIVIPQDGTLDVNVDAVGWQPVLWLMDRNNQVFIGQAESPPVSLSLPPGAYRLGIQSVENLGDYTLSLSFASRVAACNVRQLPLNGTSAEELTAADCTLSEYYFGGSPDPVDPFLLHLDERGEVLISMRSTDIDTFLVLIAGPFPNAALNIAAKATLNDDVDPAGGDVNSEIRAVLPAGDYLVLPTNAIAGEYGPYQLTTAFSPRPAPTECAVNVLQSGTALDTELDGFECTANDLDPLRAVWSPVDRYRVTAPSRGTLGIQVSSGSFFPRLRLFNPATGALVGDDYDQNFLDSTASLGFFTTAAEYELQVESVSDTQFTGDYQLQMVFTPAADTTSCMVMPIDKNATAQGALESGDCTWPEVPGGVGVPAAAAPPVDVYRVTVAQMGTLTATASAGLFRPYVELLNHRRALLEGQGPISIGLPAEVNALLIPGDYYLHTLSQDSAIGSYELGLSFGAAPFDPDASPEPTPSPVPSPTPTRAPPPIEPTPDTGGDHEIFIPWTERS